MHFTNKPNRPCENHQKDPKKHKFLNSITNLNLKLITELHSGVRKICKKKKKEKEKKCICFVAIKLTWNKFQLRRQTRRLKCGSDQRLSLIYTKFKQIYKRHRCFLVRLFTQFIRFNGSHLSNTIINLKKSYKKKPCIKNLFYSRSELL